MNPEQPNGAVPPPQQPFNPPQTPGQTVAPGTPVQPGVVQEFPAPAAPDAHLDHTPYDFIMNPEKQAKVPVNPLGGSLKQKLVVIGGGALVLILIVVVLSSLLKGGGINVAAFIPVEQEQVELVRVATAGATTSTDSSTQAFAQSVQLSVTSDNQKLTTYITGQHGKIDPKVLGLKHSTDTDTQLQNAQASNTYDSTLRSILQNDLASYSQALKAAYATNPGPNGNKLLNEEYNAAQLLIQQSKQ